MPRELFLPMLRELASCFQAFERYSAAHVRTLGLTPAQFDIVATLGNTPGMTFKELGGKTLITKGTLTGVVDRLAGRGLVRRRASPEDGRKIYVELTPAGRRLFARVFPEHVAHVKRAFARLAPVEIARLRRELAALRGAFESMLPK